MPVIGGIIDMPVIGGIIDKPVIGRIIDMPVIGRIIDMPVIGGDKRCKIPILRIAYITVYYSAIFLLTL